MADNDFSFTLADSLGGMNADGAVQIVRELCAQLGEEPAFHGNIWPGNIALNADGAAVLGEGSKAPVSERTASQVEFLSPEYFWEDSGTPASDVYSLGLILYAGCNGGALPFQPKGGTLADKDRSAALRMRMKGDPMRLPGGLSDGLGAVLKRALAYEPEDRYASAAELLAELSATDEALPAGTASFIPPFEPGAGDGQKTATITAAESEPAPAAEEKERKYTVKKDFDSSGRRYESAAPASRRRKRTSVLIPILCVLAIAIIGVAIAYTVLRIRTDTAQSTLSESFVAEATEEPEPTMAPSPAADEDTMIVIELNNEDADDGQTEEAQPIERLGSETVDGQEVEAANETVYVTSSGVNLRSGPGTAYDIVETLTRGTTLLRTGVVNGWSQVQYEGEEYYASSSLLTTTDPLGRDPEALETTPAPEADAGSDSGSGSDNGSGSSSGNGSSSSGGSSSSSGGSSSSSGSSGSSSGGSGSSSGGGGSSSGGSVVTVTDTRDVVKVTGSEVNLRTGPGANYSVSTTVKAGDTLQRTGIAGSWSRVVYAGKDLYISNELISAVSATDVTPAVGTLKVTSDVNVRSGASTDDSILGVAKVGTILNTTGIVDGKWYRVSYDGKEGYVNRKLVSVQDFALVTDASGTLTIVSRANVRSGPGTGYSILGVAEVGDTLTITGTTDSHWYRVSYNGGTGFIAANLIKVN